MDVSLLNGDVGVRSDMELSECSDFPRLLAAGPTHHRRWHRPGNVFNGCVVAMVSMKLG